MRRTRRRQSDAELEAEHQAALVDRFEVQEDGTLRPVPPTAPFLGPVPPPRTDDE